MVDVHDVELRKENVSAVVQGFALQRFKIKPLVMVKRSSAWKETYFQETSTELTGGLGSDLKGVPRLANFPHVSPTWTEKNSWQVKHGAEGVIAMEDVRTSEIDVIGRMLLRIARAVAKSVDDEIWDVITENQSATNINSVAIAAGSEWDSATIANRNPIDDILQAIQKIEEANYDWGQGNGFILVSPKDKRNLLANPNIRNAGQFYSDGVTKNGVIGRLLGGELISSTTVTADYCLVGIKKECATYQEVYPLTVTTIEEPQISWTVRASELGVTQLTNPKALTLISNTQA